MMSGNGVVDRAACVQMLSQLESFYKRFLLVQSTIESDLDAFRKKLAEDDDAAVFSVATANAVGKTSLVVTADLKKAHHDFLDWVNRVCRYDPVIVNTLEQVNWNELSPPQRANKHIISPECAQAWKDMGDMLSRNSAAISEAVKDLFAVLGACIDRMGGSSQQAVRTLTEKLREIEQTLGEYADVLFGQSNMCQDQADYIISCLNP